MSHIRIVMTGHGRGEVFIDGKKVEGVTEIDFTARALTEANRVRLCILAPGVEIEGPAEVSRVMREIAEANDLAAECDRDRLRALLEKP